MKKPDIHLPAGEIERNDFMVEKGEDVVGRLAVIELEQGDTLPDIARHFSLGINRIQSANPGVDVWAPEAGQEVLLPLSFILPDTPKKGIVINLAAMRLFFFRRDGGRLAVSTYPVGIGTPERPTPMGRMHVSRKKVRPTWHVPASIAEDHRKKGDPLPGRIPPGPLNPLGEYALYLSAPSYLIHGTNKPASIGLRATNGCIRLYPEDIERLFQSTPPKTPVRIVNQPYLAGQRDGVVYLEAHRPPQGSDGAEWNRVLKKVKKIEKDSGRSFDWSAMEKIVSEARGIPIPIPETGPEGARPVVKPARLRHPGRLHGKPEVPELEMDAWYVLAASLKDRVEALRLAAILNHQGPQIPARVVSAAGRHRVLAGPFHDTAAAKDAVKRLKIDLEMDAILVEPEVER